MSILYEAGEGVAKLGVDVPPWIDQDITTCTVASILEGGCASGAYMPAVTYYDAQVTMREFGNEVAEFVANQLVHTIEFDPELQSWSSLCCEVLSIAVELWALAVEDELVEALGKRDDL